MDDMDAASVADGDRASTIEAPISPETGALSPFGFQKNASAIASNQSVSPINDEGVARGAPEGEQHQPRPSPSFSQPQATSDPLFHPRPSPLARGPPLTIKIPAWARQVEPASGGQYSAGSGSGSSGLCPSPYDSRYPQGQGYPDSAEPQSAEDFHSSRILPPPYPGAPYYTPVRTENQYYEHHHYYQDGQEYAHSYSQTSPSSPPPIQTALQAYDLGYVPPERDPKASFDLPDIGRLMPQISPKLQRPYLMADKDGSTGPRMYWEDQMPTWLGHANISPGDQLLDYNSGSYLRAMGGSGVHGPVALPSIKPTGMLYWKGAPVSAVESAADIEAVIAQKRVKTPIRRRVGERRSNRLSEAEKVAQLAEAEEGGKSATPSGPTQHKPRAPRGRPRGSGVGRGKARKKNMESSATPIASSGDEMEVNTEFKDGADDGN